MSEEKATNKKSNILKFIIDTFVFIVMVVVVGFVISTLFINKLSMAPTDGNALRQIYDLTKNVGHLVIDTSFQIECFICILLAITIISALWNIFKFNRLEKRIAEIQEKLNKEQV